MNYNLVVRSFEAFTHEQIVKIMLDSYSILVLALGIIKGSFNE